MSTLHVLADLVIIKNKGHLDELEPTNKRI